MNGAIAGLSIAFVTFWLGVFAGRVWMGRK